MLKWSIITVGLMLFSFNVVLEQSQVVTSKVADANGSARAGANVSEKGGKFQLGSATIILSYKIIPQMPRLLSINLLHQAIMDPMAKTAPGQNSGYCKEQMSLGKK